MLFYNYRTDRPKKKGRTASDIGGGGPINGSPVCHSANPSPINIHWPTLFTGFGTPLTKLNEFNFDIPNESPSFTIGDQNFWLFSIFFIFPGIIILGSVVVVVIFLC